MVPYKPSDPPKPKTHQVHIAVAKITNGIVVKVCEASVPPNTRIWSSIKQAEGPKSSCETPFLRVLHGEQTLTQRRGIYHACVGRRT
jgi:hypothetical protein